MHVYKNFVVYAHFLPFPKKYNNDILNTSFIIIIVIIIITIRSIFILTIAIAFNVLLLFVKAFEEIYGQGRVRCGKVRHCIS